MTGLEIKAMLNTMALGINVATKAVKLYESYALRIESQEAQTQSIRNQSQQQQNQINDLYQELQDQAVQTRDLHQEMQTLIISSTETLQRSIEIGIGQVIQKIEQDKMEELLSRIRNISMLLSLRRNDQAFQYALLLKESVDYANNRLKEGKNHWFIPYLTGMSMVVATLAYLGNNSIEMAEVLKRIIRDAKYQVLDTIALDLAQTNKSLPWTLIKNVLDDEDNSIQELIDIMPIWKMQIES